MSLSIDAPTPPPVPTVWAYSDPSSDAAFSPVVWLPLTFLLTTCLLFISLRRAHALRLYADAQDWLRTKYPWIFSSHIRLSGRSDRTSASSRPHRRSSRPSPAASSLRADLSDDENAAANHMLAPDNDDGDDELEDLDGDELPFSTTSPLYQSSSVRPMWNKAVDSSRSFLNTLGWGEGAGVGSNQGRDGMARAFWGIPKKDRIGTIRLGSTAASGAAPRSGTGPSSGGLSGVAGLLGRITDLAGRSRNDAYLPVDRQSRSRGDPQTTLFDLERGDEEQGDDAVELPSGFMLESVGSTGKPSV